MTISVKKIQTRMKHYFRPLHFVVLAVTIPLSLFYLGLMISDLHSRHRTVSVSNFRVDGSYQQQSSQLPLDKTEEQTVSQEESSDDLDEVIEDKKSSYLNDDPQINELVRKDNREPEIEFNRRELEEVEDEQELLETVSTKVAKAPTTPEAENSSTEQNNLTEEIATADDNNRNESNPIQNNCTIEYANEKRLPQDDSCLIDLIRQIYLNQSIQSDTTNQPENPEEDDQVKSDILLQMLQNQTNGFFVESGVRDEETFSNTLYMEKFLEWNGLLVEANPRSYQAILSRHRKASAFPVCLSPESYPIKMTFNSTVESTDSLPPILNELSKNSETPLDGVDVYTTQCFPLYSILLAINRTQIDVFKLNADGLEFQILKTIPWEKLDVTALSVALNHVPEGEVAVSNYMKSNGFVRVDQMSNNNTDCVIYVKDFVKNKLE